MERGSDDGMKEERRGREGRKGGRKEEGRERIVGGWRKESDGVYLNIISDFLE